MASPVSGPTFDYRQFNNSRNLPEVIWQRWKYGQAMPHSMVLPYELQVSTAQISEHSSVSALQFLRSVDDFEWNSAYAVCYSRLLEAVSARAELLVTVAGLSQSVAMIEARAIQLLKVVKALRKLDFGGAARALKVQDWRPKNGKLPKTVGDAWLEFSFGWSPMISDIYNAVDVLQSPIKSCWVKARAASLQRNTKIPVGDGDSRSYNWANETPYPYQTVAEWHQIVSKAGVQMGLECSVENPNLWLANQLGVINPAKAAWDVLPWSFVVDWVFPISQFLSYGTDMIGLSVGNAYTTRVVQGQNIYRYLGMLHHWEAGTGLNDDGTSPRLLMMDDPDERYSMGTFFAMRRVLGLTKPVPYVAPQVITGWKRAFNACGLLMQALR